MKWPKILCEPDNVTPCPVRVGGAAVGIFYHAGVGYILGIERLSMGFPELSMYCTHMMGLLSTIGIGVGIKSACKGDTQP